MKTRNVIVFVIILTALVTLMDIHLHLLGIVLFSTVFITGVILILYDILCALLSDFFMNRAVAKYELGDYEGAKADFDRAFAVHPDAPKAYYERGIVKRKLGDPDGAKADFDRAAEAYYERGIVKSNEGDYKDAKADFDRAIEIKPDCAEAWRCRDDAIRADAEVRSRVEDRRIEDEVSRKLSRHGMYVRSRYM